eukprot:NODE_1283_length_1439_cov_0.681343.p2 type:complete len:113 gc:universal NODE_1283_length_1439_cov_0.681343:399-737(+)
MGNNKLTKRKSKIDFAPKQNELEQEMPRKLKEMLQADIRRKEPTTVKRKWTNADFSNATKSLSDKKKEQRKNYFKKKKDKKKRVAKNDDGYVREVFEFGDISHCPPDLNKFF